MASNMASKAVIAEISRRIFGNLAISHVKSGNKVLREKLYGNTMVSWYPEDPSVFAGTDYFKHLREEREQKLDKLRRRGKGPPKKGHGKRAGKKK